MLGFFSSKSKIEVGSLCEVQHPVSNQWVHGSITRDEGDGYFSVLIDSSEELLNHIHTKKIRKVRIPDRPMVPSEKLSSKSTSSGSVKTGGRNFSLFGNSKKVTEQMVIPIEETPSPVEDEEEEKPPMVTRKSSIKALVVLPEENFTKKIQRRKLDNEELVWLERSRKCHQVELKTLDLSNLHLIDTVPEIFAQEPFTQVPEIIGRKNFLTSLAPLNIFQSVVKLDVSYNLFVEAENIRDSFQMLSNLATLRILDMSGNHLEHIPTEIYTLTKLEILILKRNSLRDVPSAMIACANLNTLDLSYNSIATVPSVFEEMKLLADLNLDKNPCVEGGLQSLQASNAGEKTIFLLEKRLVLRDRQFRRGVVQNASKIQQAVLEKEKNQIISHTSHHESYHL